MEHNTISKLAFGGLLLTAIGAYTPAQAQKIDERDKMFLQTEAQGTSYEMAIAQLALNKAQQPAIKIYSQMIISDHSHLDSQLKNLAQSKGIELPTNMTNQQQTELTRLQGLSGTAFDQAYEQETIRINGEDKTKDQKELSATTDETVKQFVQQLQTTDQKHFTAGEALKRGG